MESQYDQIIARFDELTSRLGDKDVLTDASLLQKVAKERSDMEEVVAVARRLREISNTIRDNKEVISSGDDEEISELARAELEEIEPEQEELVESFRMLMVPKDPNDSKNTIVEIRAGAGGEESSLFVADLLRMYTRFIERQGWKMELLGSSETGVGGFKEVVFLVSGMNAFGVMKYESGVHRVQRVPATESQGRIHTSAASVAVLPEVADVEVDIDANDLRIDVFRSSGPGGQSVNTTDSAVRITHVPTGIVVSCQDEKSQHKNRAKAMKVLRARIQDAAQQAQQNEQSAERKSQIGSGDRSAKIRTYNFPQQRVTDHRIHFTLHRLTEILDGDLNELTGALARADMMARMQ